MSDERFFAHPHFEADVVAPELRDNGCGFNIQEECDRFGLLGVQERVTEMRSKLITDSAPERHSHFGSFAGVSCRKPSLQNNRFRELNQVVCGHLFSG